MLLLIDNYDSFTYNLYHFLGELGADCVVKRNDALTVSEALALDPDGIVLSPGPCDPDRAGICLDLVDAAATREIPLLGVCLGHQCIGQSFGGKVVRAGFPMHGKVSQVRHTGEGILSELPSPFAATRYHSLVVDPGSMPNVLTVNASTDDGTVMGFFHQSLPIHGVQFHPESIASEHGHQMLKNFLNLTRSVPA